MLRKRAGFGPPMLVVADCWLVVLDAVGDWFDS
jgi:hypothetical protein